MTKQRYADAEDTFRPATARMIQQADGILREYTSAGLVVTVRQLYYQFVARGLISNTEQSYKRVIDIVGKARMAGLLDWDAIEDRGRVPQVPSEWSSIESIVDVAIKQFRLPRWNDQPHYAEAWIEKQALAGVLSPLASKLHVTLMVNKGYSSLSAMRESAQRFMRRSGQEAEFRVNKGQKESVLFYVGDHDPSGEDMVRDVRDRLANFGVTKLRVVKVALTMAQVEQYDPPPNPAKVTDSRFEAYRQKYGDQSWELDALDPPTLQRLIREAVESVLDTSAMDATLAEEEKQRARLRTAMVSVRTGHGDAVPMQDVLAVLRSLAENHSPGCDSCQRFATRERKDEGARACDEHAECECNTPCRGLCCEWSDLWHAPIIRLAMRPLPPR